MRALIVDDSRFIRRFLRENLEPMGIVCFEASDGLQALQLVRGGEPYDLMLIDVNMPVMGGLECLSLLSDDRHRRSMQVMVVTTESDHAFIEKALQLGANEFLMKPFTQRGLREKLSLMGLPLL